MLKLFLTLIQVLIGFYWAGDMARQNKRIDASVSLLEQGYGAFNERVKTAKLIDGLSMLRRFYGCAAVISSLVFFFVLRLLPPNQQFAQFLSTIVLISTFGWFSIKWCIDHKKTFEEVGSHIALGIFSPLLIGAFDLLLGTPFTQILAQAFYSLPSTLISNLPRLTNPIAIGGAISLLFAILFAICYALTWLLSAPLAFASVAIVLLPVAMARFIDTLAPKRSFVGFTFVLFAGVTFWSLYV